MSCKILIENPSANFYPGSYIDGRVVCQFDNQKDIRGVKLRLKGKEHTEWTKKTAKSTTYYKGNNVFLETELTLQGAGHVGPGRCEYPFKLNLPNNCPGTYNFEDNYIQYSIKAVVDIPFLRDYEDKMILSVVAPLDFNTLNVNLNPVHLQADKTLLCLWCASGPITLDLYLDKQAYILGETIKFRIHCSNLSKENIMFFAVTLEKIIKITASGTPKEHTQLLASMDVPGIGAHGERDYDLTMAIPYGVNLPNFNMCTLFELICRFRVTAELPTFYRNFGIEVLLTLGNISSNRQPVDANTVPYPPPPSYSNTGHNSNATATAPSEEGKALLQRGLGFN